MQSTQILLFVGAMWWGVAMKMGYDRLMDDAEVSDRQIGYVTIIYYGLILLSILLSLWLGEGAILGYIIGVFFIGAYRGR